MDLPPGWQELSLAEVAGRGFLKDGDWVETKDQDPQGTVRLTQLADIGVGEFRDRSDRWMRPDQVAAVKGTLLAPDDVLIARMPDPIGRACVFPEVSYEAVTAVDVSVLRIGRSDVYPRYVMWAVNSPTFHQKVVANQSGTTRKRIARKKLEALTVPLPPVHEQRHVVDLLEEQISRLDAALLLLSRLYTKSSAMEAEWLREQLGSPKEQEVVSIGDCLLSSRGGWSRSRLHSVSPSEGTPYLKMHNITSVGELDLADVTYVVATPNELERYGVLEGDILFNSKNSRELVGKTAVATSELQGWVYNENIMRLRFDSRLLPAYVGLWFRSPNIRGAIERAARASTNVAAVYQHQLVGMPIWAPPLEVQRELVARHAELNSSAARLRGVVKTQTTRADGLRRSILEAAFSGRLTGRSLSAEIVDELAPQVEIPA